MTSWKGVLMAVRHSSEFSGIHGVRKEVDQFGELVVGYKGIRGGEELEFGGVGREYLAEGADLFRIETFGFEYFIGDLDTVLVLVGVKHADPQLINIVVGGKSMAVGIDKRKGRFMRCPGSQGRGIGFESFVCSRDMGMGSVGGQGAADHASGMGSVGGRFGYPRDMEIIVGMDSVGRSDAHAGSIGVLRTAGFGLGRIQSRKAMRGDGRIDGDDHVDGVCPFVGCVVCVDQAEGF